MESDGCGIWIQAQKEEARGQETEGLPTLTDIIAFINYTYNTVAVIFGIGGPEFQFAPPPFPSVVPVPEVVLLPSSDSDHQDSQW